MKIIGIPTAILITAIATGFAGKPKANIKLPKSFTTEFAYVPEGSISVETVEQEINAFFALKTEVSNIQYRQFLAAMDTADDNTQKAVAIYKDNWIKGRWNNEPFVEYYSTHPAYDNYPVVNITHEAAQIYCEWLTARYKTQDLGLPENMQLTFRLPNRAEWMHAASGGNHGPYAWGGPYLHNTKGEELANFLSYGPENISFDPESETYKVVPLPISMGVAGAINRSADITAPVRTHAPNGFELYNMNGNVAEMLAKPGVAAGGSWASTGYDIRNESLMTFDGSSPVVGFRPIAVLTQF